MENVQALALGADYAPCYRLLRLFLAGFLMFVIAVHGRAPQRVQLRNQLWPLEHPILKALMC